MELTAVPFFPQEKDQCGPAALTTLLVHAGKQLSPDQVAGKVFLPGRKGSLQLELVAASRGYGLIPYIIEPSLESLLAELQAGRPVLILQNLGLTPFSLYHYAVVIGYESDQDIMILRSGTTRRQLLSVRQFLLSWQQPGSWAMVVLRPGEMPASPDQHRYLNAVAALEEIGRFEEALAGYQTAFHYWPDLDTALLGMGNCWYGLGRLDAAENAFSKYTEQWPEQAVGYNNLAHVLAEQKSYEEALAVLDRALSLAEVGEGAREMLQQTRAEVIARQLRSQQ